MKVPKRCYCNPAVFPSPSLQPLQNPQLCGVLRQPLLARQEMTVSDKNLKVEHLGDLHFKRVKFFSVKTSEYHVSRGFCFFCDEFVEKAVKVSFRAHISDVGMVSWHAIDNESCHDFRKRINHVVPKQSATFKRLFQPDKVLLGCLVRIDRFTIKDVTEKANSSFCDFVMRRYLNEPPGNPSNRVSGKSGVPFRGSPSIVEIADKENEMPHTATPHRFRQTHSCHSISLPKNFIMRESILPSRQNLAANWTERGERDGKS